MKISKVYKEIKEIDLQTITLCLLALTIPWAMRFSSLAIVLAVVVSLSDSKKNLHFEDTFRTLIGLFILYFLFHLSWWIFQTKVDPAYWLEVEKKLSLLFIPLVLLNQYRNFNEHNIKLILGAFRTSVFVAATFLLLFALFQFIKYNDASVFFYHNLTKPIGQHAVYFSLEIILAVLCYHFMAYKYEVKLYALIINSVLTLCLILLSSKLMLVCFVLISLYLIFSKHGQIYGSNYKLLFVGLIFTTLIAVITIPKIRERFTDISIQKLSLIKEQEYNASIYFDGLSLRILQMKMGVEILAENNALLIGVGSNNSQQLLNAKYNQTKMYNGQDGKGGYQGLNFHNQYVETTVRFGLLGLGILMSILLQLLRMAVNKNNPFLLITLFLFLLFFNTESVLETQRGIVLFLFFTLILAKTNVFNKPMRANG